MIIKKNKINTNFFFSVVYFFQAFLKITINTLGALSLVIILFISYYYHSSGLSTSLGFGGTMLKINNIVFEKYLGVDFLKIPQYLDIYKIKLNFLNKPKNLPKLEITLPYKSILHLERQRSIREKNNGYLPDEDSQSTQAKISIDNEKKIKAKIKSKGFRAVHWSDPLTSSYRLKLQRKKSIFGLRKFSLQKPVTKNYAYEFLFYKMLEKTGNLSLKYFLINLSVNSDKRGVYAVEEFFSKDLLERQKKRNGPIFGIEDDLGEYYPNVNYQLYNENFWLNENPEMIKGAFSILNKIKDGQAELLDHFDIDKWARFFAAVDIMGTYHGSLPKSVRLYYNPTTAKFEPIGYDAHLGAGNFSNFIISDFLQEVKINCIYICDQQSWYLKFLKSSKNKLNYNFIEKYTSYLSQYSDENFIRKFLDENKKEINSFNLAVYKENSKTDKISYKGIGPYLFDDNFLFNRSKLIKQRMESVSFAQYKFSQNQKKLIIRDNYSNFPVKAKAFNCNNQEELNIFLAGNMEMEWLHDCKQILLIKNESEKKLLNLNWDISLSKNYKLDNTKDFQLLSDNSLVNKISHNKFEILKDINIKRNTLIKKDQIFTIKEGVSIGIVNNATLIVFGDVHFNGSKNKYININSDKTGSVIFNKNTVIMNYVNIQNLGNAKLKGYSLYSGMNFIDSLVTLKNIHIKNNNSEDAINLINSTTYAENIFFENTFSDALDVDFGKLEFVNINCKKIGNDCLDFSGANVVGDYLIVNEAKDKGISAGENSFVTIENIEVSDTKVGIAIKDGSKASLTNVQLEKNTYDYAVYNKKSQYSSPVLDIKKITFGNKKSLLSLNSTVVINEKNIAGTLKNKYINSILY